MKNEIKRPCIEIIRQNEESIVVNFIGPNREWCKQQVFYREETMTDLLHAYITITGDEPINNRLIKFPK